ncbi:MAG: PEP-CTERM sorting domain-containing protein [Pseudomonadota bacterium]|nr:PEP-CTERM sorting domain-containing protein [Pseudomonadota bacterium]
MSSTLIRALAIAALFTTGSAQAFVIDGNLNDWGVKNNGTAAGLAPDAGVKAHTLEDQHGSNYLNPGYGNQAYDAEAMYVAWDANQLYIGIMTGHSPLTLNKPSANSYGAGDIAIDFGINGHFDYGIELLGGATTTRGHVYSGVNWAVGLFRSNGSWTGYYDPGLAANRAQADSTHPTSILSGTDIGTGTVAYTTVGQANYGAWPGDLHYFYEVSVPLSLFGADWASGGNFRVHWSQNCANDSIWVDATATRLSMDTIGTVPEPGTLALLPLGMLGLMALRRNKPSTSRQHAPTTAADLA